MARLLVLSLSALVAGALVSVASARPPGASERPGPATPSPLDSTNRLMVTLDPRLSPALTFGPMGLRPLHALASDSRVWVVEALTPVRARQAASTLARRAGVSRVLPDVRVRIARDQFTPNDPFYFPNQPTAGWSGQWHLNNTFIAGRDLNVVPAWARGITGLGTVIGIVDDGVQVNHPDLNFNFSATNSRDFGQGDNDPSPVSSLDNHGTAVAGLAVARGGNGLGVTGVAPQSAFAALRLDFDASVGTWISHVIDATLWRSSGATTTIRVKNHSYGPTTPYDPTLLPAVDAMVTSANAGTLHVRSGGNARNTTVQDANTSAERNSPSAIAVAALGSDGVFAAYSNFGACLAVTVPSSASRGGTLNLMTTDRTGDGFGYNGNDSFPDANYTSTFGGTSGAAPQLTGALALTRQVNPNLDVRLAKHLLARTARPVDLTDATETSDGGWRTNAAGFRFNQNYGWGLLDVDALTRAAAQFGGVTPLTTWSTGTVTVGAAIPDGNLTGLIRRFTSTATQPLEEVQVTLRAAHTWRGDLEAFLTSPSGTRSRVFFRGGSDAEDNLDWTFTSLAFWGEIPTGEWTLTLRDVFTSDVGTWTNYAVTLRMGEPTPAVRTLSGRITLEDFGGVVAGQPLTLRLQSPTGAPVQSWSTTLDAEGDFSVTTTQQGTFQLVANGQHWLTSRRANVVLASTASTVSGLDFSLVNGDIDGDNSITVFDYDVLSANFDRTSADPDWSTVDASGTAPAWSDLDGDGSVTVFDYDILSRNFDRVGE